MGCATILPKDILVDIERTPFRNIDSGSEEQEVILMPGKYSIDCKLMSQDQMEKELYQL